MAQTLKQQLADIDAHAERVAGGSQPGSNINELAHAVHNLVNVLETIVDRADLT